MCDKLAMFTKDVFLGEGGQKVCSLYGRREDNWDGEKGV
jgi:hypothetical protein